MTITYRIFLTLILLGVWLTSAAQDDTERRYRVELIVVRHLAGSSDTAPQPSLRDMSAILDLYAPASADAAAAAPEPADAELTEAGVADAALLPEEPIAVRIDDMSDSMREVWRRLRGSAGFRPELFRAWEQSGNEPFPTLRIHDDELLYEIDLTTPVGGAPIDEHGALVFSDQTLRDTSDGGLETQSGMEQEAPPVQYFYRIDGTATLTRSRFLHVDLDIELREPLFETLPDQPAELTSDASSIDIASDPAVLAGERGGDTGTPIPASLKRTGPAADAPAFRVHRISQKRQVKTEQVEYFDGPVIGVLVLVSGFDSNIETLEPEPVP
jgi:hypothetical protein